MPQKKTDLRLDELFAIFDEMVNSNFIMENKLRVNIEIGPKGKRVVAVAQDWPGLERGARTEEAAIEKLFSYLPRYKAVTKLASIEEELVSVSDVEVVERYQGTGSTNFWGISFGFSSFDQQAMSEDALERELSLMQACWQFFDDVRSHVSAEMKKGPRGGGRDRDRIVVHTLFAQLGWAKKLGIKTEEDILLKKQGLDAHRLAYCDAIRSYHSQRKMARTWPLRYLIRHTAYHTLDHAWEMEDKDLTGENSDIDTN